MGWLWGNMRNYQTSLFKSFDSYEMCIMDNIIHFLLTESNMMDEIIETLRQ
jgi:hypothetical protein